MDSAVYARWGGYWLLIALLAAAGGCGGKVNDELVGKWKPVASDGGDNWQFKSDGTFTIDGGRMTSLDGSGRMVSTLPRWGKWSEKNGTVTLKYQNDVPKLDNAEFRWKKTGAELRLTRAGQTAPEVVLKGTSRSVTRRPRSWTTLCGGRSRLSFAGPFRRNASSRQSTDAVACQNEDMAAALRFIRQHACAGIDVAAVQQTIHASRSTLDRKFLATLGRTVHAEIQRVQVDRVKQLLVGSRLMVKQIAKRCGFRYAEYMTMVFHCHTGQSPLQRTQYLRFLPTKYSRASR